MKVLVIPTDAPMRVEEIDEELETMQAIVGGFVETVPLRGQLPGTMWLNEEGKLHDLPRNHVASWLAYIFPGDYIAGTAFVTGPYTADGDSTDVSDKVLDALRAQGQYVEVPA